MINLLIPSTQLFCVLTEGSVAIKYNLYLFFVRNLQCGKNVLYIFSHQLQDALIFFPVMLIPLLDQCCVQPDKRVSSHPFFNSKELLDV